MKNVKKSEEKKTFYAAAILNIFEQHFSSVKQLLLITFPQGFGISKKFGHWTLRSGGKKTVKRSEKV